MQLTDAPSILVLEAAFFFVYHTVCVLFSMFECETFCIGLMIIMSFLSVELFKKSQSKCFTIMVGEFYGAWLTLIKLSSE
jgi:hypothetical protein